MSEVPSNELRNCPFCGEQPKIGEYYGYAATEYSVDCMNDNCPAYVGSPLKKTKEEAIEAWNTRAERTCTIERIEHDEYGSYYYTSCGHCTVSHSHVPGFCSECGAKVVE